MCMPWYVCAYSSVSYTTGVKCHQKICESMVSIYVCTHTHNTHTHTHTYTHTHTHTHTYTHTHLNSITTNDIWDMLAGNAHHKVTAKTWHSRDCCWLWWSEYRELITYEYYFLLTNQQQTVAMVTCTRTWNVWTFTLSISLASHEPFHNHRSWHQNEGPCGYLASYPGLLPPAFVTCSTNAGEGLVKLSHVVWHTWTCGGVEHSFCTAVKRLSESKKRHHRYLFIYFIYFLFWRGGGDS